MVLHQMRMDVYFLSSQKNRPSLFGLPLVVPSADGCLHQDLYQAVWTQVSRQSTNTCHALVRAFERFCS